MRPWAGAQSLSWEHGPFAGSTHVLLLQNPDAQAALFVQNEPVGAGPH